ncbi:MAG TPA: CBS domain-containing protein [Candidatus Limnocylindrales bacterium]|nr:CBS domain-containing protein [Candidatus Limnocylindrales bacterium]
MLCPVCQFDNLAGEDTCANCGAGLWTVDLPEPGTAFERRLLGDPLADLGVGPPSMIDAGVSVQEAIRRMHAEPTDCLLVVDEGRLVGIFTDRDAVLKVAGRDVENAPIRDLMTSDPVVLRPDDTVAVAINKMAVGGFRHIPIVDDGRPIGVVAARDVFRHILSLIA